MLTKVDVRAQRGKVDLSALDRVKGGTVQIGGGRACKG